MAQWVKEVLRAKSWQPNLNSQDLEGRSADFCKLSSEFYTCVKAQMPCPTNKTWPFQIKKTKFQCLVSKNQENAKDVLRKRR